MNDLDDSTQRELTVPEQMRSQWQKTVDLLADILNVPVGLITRADPPEIEVFLASATESNPFTRGARLKPETGSYCEKVIRERIPVLVPNAREDPAWQGSSVARLGMTYYLGFPVLWPGGAVFGTICVLDTRSHTDHDRFQRLLSQFREGIEKDLSTLVDARRREDLLAELGRHRDQLQELVSERTAELQKSRQILEDRVKFGNLVSDLSARFVNLSGSRRDEDIGFALGQICQFFGDVHCCLMEVPADGGPVRFVSMTDREERRRHGLSVDMAVGHPWAHHRLVELGETIVFSSPEELPPEADVDRDAWERESARALLMLPLRVRGRITHLMGLRSEFSGRKWSAECVRRMRLLGEVFANALAGRQAQELLVNSERRLAEAQRIAHLGNWDWDIPRGTHHWSDEFYRIFGLLQQGVEATYEAFLASVHPDDRQRVDQANNESVSDPEKPYAIEYRVVRPDGTERVVHARGEVLCDQNRRPVRMVGTVQDITELKRAEEERQTLMMAAQAEKERLSALVDSIADEVWFADTQKRFTLANRTALREFGLTRGSQFDIEEMVHSLEVLRPDGSPRPDEEAPALRALIGEVLRSEEEIVRTPATGELRHRQVSAAPVRDSRGEIIGAVSVVRDITERKRAEEALENAFKEIKKLKEQLEAENVYLRQEVMSKAGSKSIIGDSDPIKYITYRMGQVAATRTTVLLTGETGTGKGVFARALHEASNRREKPFVHVNCAGLPPNLIESEMFGREKGAFTGSTARQIGRFELADGGTIFLDEIGELPLDLQAKLLKVIEDGEFERLGSPHPVKVDVRIIASTNRQLQDEIKEGRFRSDLYYRLSVFPITIPPLRQRSEDIPLLAKHYLDRLARSHGKRIERIPEDIMRALQNYTWPGNVRELINVVERAVIVSDGPELRLAEPIMTIRALPAPSSGNQHAEEPGRKNLANLEREHILSTLQASGWRIEGENGAARILGINPSTLRFRMGKLGLKRPRASQAEQS